MRMMLRMMGMMLTTLIMMMLSFSENDAISSSKDEDLHNPERAYNFNRALGEHEPSTETTQVEHDNHDNQTNTLQNKEEINGD